MTFINQNFFISNCGYHFQLILCLLIFTICVRQVNVTIRQVYVSIRPAHVVQSAVLCYK